MAKLLGIDVGTSGAKALLIDDTGRVLRQALSEYPVSSPRPLWSEQDPEAWWNAVCECIRQMGEPNPDAIGLTGQMHGAVFLDEKDRVIRPAILWNDQRTTLECDEMEAIVGAGAIREITCNPPLTGFQAPKILWLRKNEPEHFARLRTVLLPKDYIRLRLTGAKATDVTDASGVGLFDVTRREWSNQLIEGLGLDASLFPPVYESAAVCSNTTGGGGLRPGIPVVAGAGDQAAGAVGTGAVSSGVVSVSLGTSGVVFTALDQPRSDPAGAAHTFCHANGRWHAMGVMLSCGGAIRWFRDSFMSNSGYDEVSSLAATAPAGCEGLTFLPYLTGERCPHNDPRATAAFCGVTARHSLAHLARAVLEGVTFGLAESMDILRALGATSGEIRVTGGGARNAFWMQMLTDVLGAPCATLEADEGPSYGAAILAGVGTGVWPDVRKACEAIIRKRSVASPSGEDYTEAKTRYASLYSSLKTWSSQPGSRA